MDLNMLAKEVHQNAVDHGWWDEDRSTLEVLALIHSELSEALEEYRAGRPMLWHECEGCEREYEDVPVICEECKDCCYKKNADDGMNCPDIKKAKPEGIAVELIDAVIRMLDYTGKNGIEIDELNDNNTKNLIKLYYDDSLPTFISHLHFLVATTYRSMFGIYGEQFNKAQGTFGLAIFFIFKWIRDRGLDPEAIIAEKHQYNKTRSYKHGGKKC